MYSTEHICKAHPKKYHTHSSDTYTHILIGFLLFLSHQIVDLNESSTSKQDVVGGTFAFFFNEIDIN